MAPSIPYSPSCHFPPSWRVWGTAEVLGAQRSAGSRVWSRVLEVQQDCTGLGYPGKGLFPIASRCSAPSTPAWGAGGQLPASLSFFFKTERTHKKANNPAQRSKEGKKKPRASVGSGEKHSLIIHEGWLGQSRPLEIPTYQPELLLLPKRAPFICFRLLH